MTTHPVSLDVNEKIECARTLASRFYTEPSILEIEKSKIFHKIWQMVGTLDQPCGEMNGANHTIADPETFFTAELAGEPIVIVRDKQGRFARSVTYAAIEPDPLRQAAAA